jgi:hypothetical protein
MHAGGLIVGTLRKRPSPASWRSNLIRLQSFAAGASGSKEEEDTPSNHVADQRCVATPSLALLLNSSFCTWSSRNELDGQSAHVET